MLRTRLAAFTPSYMACRTGLGNDAFGGPLRNPARPHLHLERPRLALVDRRLAEPPERAIGDFNETPPPHDALVLLAHLHDVVADRAADLAHFKRPRRLEERDVPRIDRRIIPAERGAVEVPRLGGSLLVAQPSRRKYPDVLDRPAVEHPIEMPLAFGAARRSVQLVPVDVEMPRCPGLAVELPRGRTRSD